MDETALILGVAGIAGTLLSPWLVARLAGKRQQRAFAHERTMRDEEELRTVLDDVAAAVESCFAAMHTAYAAFLRWGRRIRDEPRGREAVEGLTAASDRLGLAIARLGVRLGAHHPVRRAAIDIQLAYSTFGAAILDVAYLGAEADLAEEGAAMEKRQADFDAARRAFVDVAAAYAGSRLPRQLDLELGFRPGELAGRREAGA